MGFDIVSTVTASGLKAMTYVGTWNANTNSPALATGVGNKGDYYVVSISGSTNLDTITDWDPGDWVVFNGTIWEKVDNTDQNDQDHGNLQGLNDDDHPNYHNDTRGDARYYKQTQFISTSAGSADANKPIKSNTDGNIDKTFIDVTALAGTGLEANGDTVRIATSTAGAGLSGGGGSALAIGDAGKGIQINANDIQFDPSEITNSGLEQVPGVGNEHLLRIAASVAGSGLTGGGGVPLQVKPENTTVNVTAAGISVNFIDTVYFPVSGVLAVGADYGIGWIASRAATITKATLFRRLGGNSGVTVIDINKNATTIFTTQGNRPTIASTDGNNAINVKTNMDVTNLAAGDRLSMDIDAVETGFPVDMAVTIEVTYP